MPTDQTADEPTQWQRELPHLIAMCDGKRHGFFDHEMAAALKQRGLIHPVSGGYFQITEQGRMAVVHNGK